MVVKSNLLNQNYEQIECRIIKYIQDFVKDKSAIIGLSGGIDSSIVCALAVKSLGKDKIKGIIVKNSRYSEENLRVANEYAMSLGLETLEIDTGLMVNYDYILSNLGINQEDRIKTSTLDGRICDVLIRTVAGLDNRIYLGTINGTERLTGWYPKGALVGDFCPIGGLLKEQEKGLAKYMGLESLIETISDDASRVCSGCGELPDFKGIPYPTLDEILYIYETSKGDELTKKLRDSGIKPDVASKILRRAVFVDHKNDLFPSFCKINYPTNNHD